MSRAGRKVLSDSDKALALVLRYVDTWARSHEPWQPCSREGTEGHRDRCYHEFRRDMQSNPEWDGDHSSAAEDFCEGCRANYDVLKRRRAAGVERGATLRAMQALVRAAVRREEE